MQAEAKKKAKEEAVPYYLDIFEKLLAENNGSGFFVSKSVRTNHVLCRKL